MGKIRTCALWFSLVGLLLAAQPAIGHTEPKATSAKPPVGTKTPRHQTHRPPAAFAGVWSLLFADGFERGTAGWSLNGDWALRSEGGQQKLHGVGYAFAQANTTWDDYRLEVRVLVLSGEAKIVLRAGEFNAGYYLGLAADGELSLDKWDGAGWTHLGSAPGSLTASRWYTLALEGAGPELRAFVDNQLSIQASDADYAEGFPMLVAASGEAEFDDVWVTGDAPAACALVPGNGLSTPFGIAFNTRGELFVADGGKLSRVSEQGWATRVARVGDPGDLAIDEHDNMYVTAPNAFAVLKVSPQGTSSELVGLADMPWNLTMGPDGYLYAGVAADILRINPDDGSTGLWMSGVAGAMAFDAARDMYVLTRIENQDQILRITPDRTRSLIAVLPDIRPTRQYEGLAVDGDGNLYVGESLGVQSSAVDPPWVPPIVADKVYKITPDGQVSAFASGLGGVWDLTFGPGGLLYVTEHDRSGVSKIATDGSVTPLIPCSGLASVDSAAYHPHGTLHFVNTESYTVSRLHAQGQVEAVGTGFNVAGCGGGRPPLAFDPGGTLFIGEAHDVGPNRIVSIAGGTAAVFSHDVACPNGMALHPTTGDWYVSEGLLGNIVRFSPDGTRHGFVSGLSHPMHLAFGPDGLLYVAEYGADRISRIDAGGTVAQFASVPAPFGLAFQGDDLFVSLDSERGEIRRVDPAGVATRFTYGPGYVGGITLAPDGNLVAPFSSDNSIYRFTEGGTMPGVAVTAPVPVLGAPGQVVTHTFTVHNDGNGQDGFRLAVASELGWPVHIAGGALAGPLHCAKAEAIQVVATIPPGTAPGVRDRLTLTATSRLEPGTAASVQSITVSRYVCYLPAIVAKGG